MKIPKTSGTFVSYDGTEIYYEIRGQGKPLILCYGIACSINHWRFQLDHFSRSFKTIVVDYRGHHKSASPLLGENMTVEAIAKDIIGLCHFLEIEMASFWGHSFGAQIIAKVAEDSPDLFSNAVLINGFVSNPLDGMFGINMNPAFKILRSTFLSLPETFRFFWRSMVDNAFSNRLTTLAGGFSEVLAHPKDIEIYSKGVSNLSPEDFLTLFKSMATYDGRASLSKWKIPTLILAGSKDMVTPIKFQKDLCQKIQGSILKVVPFGTHCSLLDLPDLVNSDISDFLDSLDY